MNKDSLVKKSIFNILYKALNVLFPLITTTYASHILGANGIGKIASVQNIAQYFVLIACLGIPSYGTREIAKYQNDKKHINKVFNELYIINFFSTSVCVVLYFSMISSIKYFSNNKLLFLCAGISIVLNYLNVEWVFQGIEEYRFIAMRNFIVKIVFLIATFIFVRKPSDILSYMFLLVLGTAGNYLLNVLNLRKRGIHFCIEGINLSRHIKSIMILLGVSISVELYTMTDTTMLTFLCTSKNVGYYSNSIKMVKIVVMVITAISGVLLPRISYYRQQGLLGLCEEIINKVMNVLLFIIIPCIIGLTLISDDFVVIFFGKDFAQAATTLKILSLLFLCIGLSNLFCSQVLLTYGHEKRVLYTTIVGAVVNIMLNSMLIPFFNEKGAAVASVISEFTVCIMAYLLSKKYVKYKMNTYALFKEICSALLMIIVIVGIKILIENIHIRFFLCVVFGGIIYIFSNIVLKNEIFIRLVNSFVNKKKITK